MVPTWDGVTRAESLNDEARKLRLALADAAHDYDWARVFALLAKEPGFVNAWRPGGKSWFSPLHQAAHGGAPAEVARRLIELGAWRTLPDAAGQRPVDVAAAVGHRHLLAVLEPVYRRQVPPAALARIQQNFHAVIRGRADEMVREHALRLPELAPLLELEDPATWFPVPGMYGGFSYHLEGAGPQAKLVSDSWCRVVGYSGETREITAEGSRLVKDDW